MKIIIIKKFIKVPVHVMVIPFIISFIFFPTRVSALAFCITNPEAGLCDVTATVSPAASSVVSGGNTNITFRVESIFESGNNSLAFFDTDKLEDVTGINTSPVHTGGIPTAGTFTRTRSGNSGVLTRGVSVTLFVMTQQGEIDSDTVRIEVIAAPPTVNIFFSFLDKIKMFTVDSFIGKAFAAK